MGRGFGGANGQYLGSKTILAGAPGTGKTPIALSLGAVITRGGKGALYAVRSATPGLVTTVSARPVEVIDTVGAGDSFMAGLVSGLLDAGYLGSLAARERLAAAGIDDVRPSIDRALATSSATVARAGAYAPTRSELGA